MDISDQLIAPLRAKVDAVQSEFENAIACNENWKAAALDEKVHNRLGTSYASSAFLVILEALRRETVLSLSRLWDTNPKAINLISVANLLGDNRFIKYLASERAAQWGNDRGGGHAPEVAAFIRESESKLGMEEASKVRIKAAKAIEIIKQYAPDETKRLLFDRVLIVRNEKLAHRQIVQTIAVGAM